MLPHAPFFLDILIQKHFARVCLHCKSAGAHCALLLLTFVAKMPSHIVQCRLLCESAHVYCFVLLMLRKRSFRLCCGASIRKGYARVAQTEPTVFCDLRDVGL